MTLLSSILDKSQSHSSILSRTTQFQRWQSQWSPGQRSFSGGATLLEVLFLQRDLFLYNIWLKMLTKLASKSWPNLSFNILNKIVTKPKFQNLYFSIFQPSVFSEFQSRKKKCRRVRGLEVQRRQRCESWPGQLGYMGARVVILTPTTIFVCFCIFVFFHFCRSIFVFLYFCIFNVIRRVYITSCVPKAAPFDS